MARTPTFRWSQTATTVNITVPLTLTSQPSTRLTVAVEEAKDNACIAVYAEEGQPTLLCCPALFGAVRRQRENGQLIARVERTARGWSITLSKGTDIPEWPRLFHDRGFSRSHTQVNWDAYNLSALDDFMLATDDELEATELDMHLRDGNADECWCDEDGVPRGHPDFWARAKADGRYRAPDRGTPEDFAANEAAWQRLMASSEPQPSVDDDDDDDDDGGGVGTANENEG